MNVDVLRSIHAVDAATWDALVGDGCPFFEHAFLAAVEDAGCVGPGTGWAPRHLVLREGGRAVGAVAAWEKRNSNAEFVFDWAWADAAARAGIPYYPKLVIAAPFSPVGGARMHLGDETSPDRRRERQRALAGASVELARREGMSGVHWLFVTPEESEVLDEVGLEARHTVQFHWRRGAGETRDDGTGDFEAFLGRFNSKKRHQIRRERREVAAAGVTTRVLTGDALGPEMAPLLWSLYTSTVDKFAWGQRYLNAAFFERLLTTWRRNLLLVLAERDGQIVGGTINGAKNGVLYGRYWGGLAEIPFLHFEVCSYAGIDHCLRNGFTRFEAGAGGGSHKYGRGFDPVLTRSAHVIFHPGLDRAVRQFLREEREALRRELEAMEGKLLEPAVG
jgi:predicted N-acyltransferase